MRNQSEPSSLVTIKTRSHRRPSISYFAMLEHTPSGFLNPCQ